MSKTDQKLLISKLYISKSIHKVYEREETINTNLNKSMDNLQDLTLSIKF